MRKILSLLIFSVAVSAANAQHKIAYAKWRLIDAPTNISAYDHPYMRARDQVTASLSPIKFPVLRRQVVDIFPFDPKDVYCVIDIFNNDVIYETLQTSDGYLSFFCVERRFGNYSLIIVFQNDDMLAENCTKEELETIKKTPGSMAIETLAVKLF